MAPHWTSYAVPVILFIAASAIAIAVPAYMRRRTRLEREISGLNHDIERLESIVLRVVDSGGAARRLAPPVHNDEHILRETVDVGYSVTPGRGAMPRHQHEDHEDNAGQSSGEGLTIGYAATVNEESSIRARRVVDRPQLDEAVTSSGRATGIDIQTRWIQALRTQAKKTEEKPASTVLPCPYCSQQGRIFQGIDQLLGHAKSEHSSVLAAMDPEDVRGLLNEDAIKLKEVEDRLAGLGLRHSLDSEAGLTRDFEHRYKEANDAFVVALAQVDDDKARKVVYKKYKEQLGQLLAGRAGEERLWRWDRATGEIAGAV